MKFDLLINIIFSHEYNNESTSSEIFYMESRLNNRAILGGPKYPLIRTGLNQYSMLGDREELLDLLATSPEGLDIEFQVRSKDPNFLLYTQSLLPEKLNDSNIQLKVIDNRLNRLNVIIHVTRESLETKCPIQKEIHYQTKEAYWDFILIPRYLENASMDIFMEDNGPEKISFKNPEQIRFMDRDVFRISTEYPLKIKEESYYQRRSDITIYEKREYAKRILLKHVPAPSLGRFLIKESQSTENSIIQILYI